MAPVFLDRDAEDARKYCADQGMTWPQVFVPNADRANPWEGPRTDR